MYVCMYCYTGGVETADYFHTAFNRMKQVYGSRSWVGYVSLKNSEERCPAQKRECCRTMANVSRRAVGHGYM